MATMETPHPNRRLSATEAQNLLTFCGSRQPTLDFIVELALHQELEKPVTDRRQGRHGFVRGGDLVDQKLLVGGLDLVHVDGNPGTKALLNEGIDGGHSQHQLVEICSHQTLRLELAVESVCATAPLNQHLTGPLGIELEAKEEAAILDIPELDLESYAGVEQPGTVGVRRFVRFGIYETNQGCQLEVAEQDRSASNNRQDLLHGLPFRFGCRAEMTDSHEDERNDGGPHPVIITACPRTLEPYGS